MPMPCPSPRMVLSSDLGQLTQPDVPEAGPPRSPAWGPRPGGGEMPLAAHEIQVLARVVLPNDLTLSGDIALTYRNRPSCETPGAWRPIPRQLHTYETFHPPVVVFGVVQTFYVAGMVRSIAGSIAGSIATRRLGYASRISLWRSTCLGASRVITRAYLSVSEIRLAPPPSRAL